MKQYGPSPPWEGTSELYGSWRFVDADPYDWSPETYWEWQPPNKPGATLATLSKILRDFYIKPLAAQLNEAALRWPKPTMTAEQSKSRRKRRWWKR